MTEQLPLIERAARLAARGHKEQTRKTDGSPYIVHPFMCAMLLCRNGFRNEVVAAALTHDVLEDTSITEDEMRNELGDEVVDIVLAVSEDQTVDWRSKDGGWEKVKQMYIDGIREASVDAKAVSLADKIHNMHSLLATYAVQGPAMWASFSKGKEKKLWFEESVLQALREGWEHPLLDEYADLVEKMRRLD